MRCLRNRIFVVLFLPLVIIFLRHSVISAFDPDMKNVQTPSATTRASVSPTPTMTIKPTATPKFTTTPTSTPVVLSIETLGPSPTILPTNTPVAVETTNENKWDTTSLVIILVVCLVGAVVGAIYTFKEFKKK